MGVLEALLILFIALKLTGVIAWSWFAVLLPLLPDVLLYAVLISVAVRKRRAIKAHVAEFKDLF